MIPYFRKPVSKGPELSPLSHLKRVCWWFPLRSQDNRCFKTCHIRPWQIALLVSDPLKTGFSVQSVIFPCLNFVKRNAVVKIQKKISCLHYSSSQSKDALKLFSTRYYLRCMQRPQSNCWACTLLTRHYCADGVFDLVQQCSFVLADFKWIFLRRLWDTLMDSKSKLKGC